ncbi:MAG: FAD-dependent oxidoreductase [Candidatus Eisenbacteria bacterium]|uniref:FAD-dependent oxidoreductase n=1 Tax=Eiseniibacteriota bacterium TaxID=2212470 RepID=A0A9D6QJ66_UNCEI|nr:FAD-dependent oxidoreductase [Candidatus Eisenbacteria bacterium]MBI3540202.1 FAD-dependent oxidoreductase [Candidatus Eisenbacteria bacterium]
MSHPTSVPGSIWWAEPGPPTPAFEGELDSEILIVGGGVTGVTLAYTLADQGATVALLDAGPLAGAASGRNAGFLMVAPAEPYNEQIALWGRPGARAVLECGRRSHQRVRALVETLGIDCDYRANGSMRLTRTEEEAEDIRASLAPLKVDGFPMLEVPVSHAAPEHAVPSFTAAFVTLEDGELHPVRFIHALAREAAAKGARIYADSAVTGAAWRGGLWEARTARGVARARTLVLATNAYTPRLCPALTPIIAPRRGQMLATAPLAREVAPRPTYAHWGYHYWRQTPDQRLVIGGWRELDLDGEVGFDTIVTPTIQSAIEQALADLVPEGAAIDYRWSGTMGFARDGRPVVGWLDAEHHLAVCGGYTGHGMAMAAACTLDLADLLAWRKAPGIATFDPGRFDELRQARAGLTALGVAAQ